MQEFCAKSLFLGVKFLYMGCIMRQKCTYASKVRKIYKKIIDLSLVFRVQRTLRYCLVNGFAFLGKDKIAFVKESNRHMELCVEGIYSGMIWVCFGIECKDNSFLICAKFYEKSVFYHYW